MLATPATTSPPPPPPMPTTSLTTTPKQVQRSSIATSIFAAIGSGVKLHATKSTKNEAKQTPDFIKQIEDGGFKLNHIDPKERPSKKEPEPGSLEAVLKKRFDAIHGNDTSENDDEQSIDDSATLKSR